MKNPLPAPAAESSASTPVPSLLAAAATSLSFAAWAGGGRNGPIAIAWLSMAVGAGLMAFLFQLSREPSRSSSSALPAILACLAAQFAALVFTPIDYPVDRLGPGGLRTLLFLIGIAAVLAGSLCSARPALAAWTFPLLLAIQATLGVLLLLGLQLPGIDVLMFQRQSCSALLHGVNPYTIRFPDPYPPAASAVFYGTGVSAGGVLQFGYPYMPLTLLMALPGYLLGDVRFASLTCVVTAAALIGYSRRGPEPKAAAALVMFSPIAPLVTVLGWTESYLLVLVAIVYFCTCRAPRWVPLVFGLLLVSKQYMLGLAPLGLLLLPRPWTPRAVRDFALKAAASGLAVTAPLALWNPMAFWESAITLQARQPYRPDALSFLAWFAPSTPAAWVWLPFAGLALALTACLWAIWRRPLSFPMGTALCLLAFFALNKQAFANYYYLVIGALCVAVAAAAAEPRTG
jgi:hypothetical protein